MFFEGGQIIISLVVSLRQGGEKKNPESSMFFKHHLTVSALTDPLRQTDSPSAWGRGAGWMGAQGSIEVIRQRRREMHTGGSSERDTA